MVVGLLLIGAEMGLCITPLTLTVPTPADSQRAGVVSGALSTMQQVGNALGVAITGTVFFGALASGYAPAFELALIQLTVLVAAVAALSRRLPPRGKATSA